MHSYAGKCSFSWVRYFSTHTFKLTQANTDYILISVFKVNENYSTWATSPQNLVLLKWSWCPSRSQSSGNLLPLPESSSLPSNGWDWVISLLCGRWSKYCICRHLHLPSYVQAAKRILSINATSCEKTTICGSENTGTLLWTIRCHLSSAALQRYPGCSENFSIFDTGTPCMLNFYLPSYISLSTCGRKFCYFFKFMLSRTCFKYLKITIGSLSFSTPWGKRWWIINKPE